MVAKKNWEEHEDRCLEYLRNKYPTIDFEERGGSDSTESDILVKLVGRAFYIEAKMPQSQCGQFVLLPDLCKKEFLFSPNNKSIETKEVLAIKNFINNDFNSFCSVGSKGKVISSYLKPSFVKWIVEYYKQKGVKYVITLYDEEFIIFPLEKISNYFDIKAVFRIKKSGSSKAPKKYWTQITKIFSNDSDTLRVKNNCLVADSPRQYDRIHHFEEYDFYIPKGKVEVRKLSNTYNGNVIFEIKLKQFTQDKDDLRIFEKEIGY